MRQTTREEIVKLLVDLVSPIGPHVFAGFGSELQNKRYEWQNSRDGLGGIFEEDAQVERVIRDWALDLEPAPTLSILFAVACHGPGDETGDYLRREHQPSWDYCLAQLIAAVGSRDRGALDQLLDAHRDRAEMASNIEDILELIDNTH
jgi:hypothetical protein